MNEYILFLFIKNEYFSIYLTYIYKEIQIYGHKSYLHQKRLKIGHCTWTEVNKCFGISEADDISVSWESHLCKYFQKQFQCIGSGIQPGVCLPEWNDCGKWLWLCRSLSPNGEHPHVLTMNQTASMIHNTSCPNIYSTKNVIVWTAVMISVRQKCASAIHGLGKQEKISTFVTSPYIKSIPVAPVHIS